MAHGDRGDFRQAVHAFKGLQDTAGIGAHQAVVVEAEIGGNGAGIAIEDLFAAVVQSKGIAGVENAGAVVKRKDRVWPVQVGGAEEFKLVMHTAGGIGAQIQGFATFHGPAFEGPMHLIFQKLDRHLGSNDLNLRVALDQVPNQAGMVRFGVGHDQIIDLAGIDLPF
jgi:hypothetical protein